jgi:hypothetical protein
MTTTRTQRDFLKVQLLETQRLRDMAKDHPIMSISMEERLKEIQAKIDALPMGNKEARTVLFFSGEPVQGSLGIDAGFASRVIDPFQSMVMADFADHWRGGLGERGKRIGEADSRLLLTGLPRGSFGLELTRAENNDFFAEDQLADTLAHVIRLVDSAARSDEDFASELDATAPRVIQNLKQFLEVVAKGKAGLQMESGDFRCILTPFQANEAFNRVAGTLTRDKEIHISGVFRGTLLDSWRFNFIAEDGQKISGKIDENLTDEEAKNLTIQYLNKRCRASFVETTVDFKNGRERITYILQDIASAGETSHSLE